MTSATRTHRSRAARAFTIVEIIVVVIIIGVIAAVIAPRLLGRVGQSKQAVAASNAASIATAMRLFIADNYLPESGSSIEILFNRPSNIEESAWKGPYVDSMDSLKDPWGNFFELVIPGEVNADFDIVSRGADGQPGGEGESADIVNGRKP